MAGSVLEAFDRWEAAIDALEKEWQGQLAKFSPQDRRDILDARTWARERWYDIARDCMVADRPPPRLARACCDTTVWPGKIEGTARVVEQTEDEEG